MKNNKTTTMNFNREYLIALDAMGEGVMTCTMDAVIRYLMCPNRTMMPRFPNPEQDYYALTMINENKEFSDYMKNVGKSAAIDSAKKGK